MSSDNSKSLPARTASVPIKNFTGTDMTGRPIGIMPLRRSMDLAAKQSTHSTAATANPSVPEKMRVAPKLSKKLRRGKDCEEMTREIKTIRTEAIANGKAMFEIRENHPGFRIWNAVKELPQEGRDVFETPTQWGGASGYANQLLSKLYDPMPSAATVNDWRKAFRAHQRRETS
jgi:hypothetical protein